MDGRLDRHNISKDLKDLQKGFQTLPEASESSRKALRRRLYSLLETSRTCLKYTHAPSFTHVIAHILLKLISKFRSVKQQVTELLYWRLYQLNKLVFGNTHMQSLNQTAYMSERKLKLLSITNN